MSGAVVVVAGLWGAVWGGRKRRGNARGIGVPVGAGVVGASSGAGAVWMGWNQRRQLGHGNRSRWHEEEEGDGVG